jgi:ELWxxDGT repeat protein
VQRQIVMFAGTDASNNIGLWETNGTVAGTHELTGISGANTGTFNQFSGGVFPSELTVVNGDCSFGA